MMLSRAMKAAAGQYSPIDPFFKNVTLLLQANGNNGSQNQTVIDSSNNNYASTSYGEPANGSFSPYWPEGYWSQYFDNGYIQSYSSDFQIDNSTDFCIETWYNPIYKRSSYPMIWNINGYNVPDCIYLSERNGSLAPGKFCLYIYNYSYFQPFMVSTTSVKDGTWYHLAVTRSGTEWRLFVNGVQEASRSSSVTPVGAGNTPRLGIGSSFNSNDTLNGYVSNFRFTKGSAVYTANFTPSAIPLTAIQGTVLLTCQSNRTKDNSAVTKTITSQTVTMRCTTFSPFKPTQPYTANTYGGSIYFDGTTDATKTTSSAANFNISYKNFSLEFWWYPFSVYGNTLVLQTGNMDNLYQGWYLFKDNTNLYLKMNDSLYTQQYIGEITLNEWNHIALIGGQWWYSINSYINGKNKRELNYYGFSEDSDFKVSLVGTVNDLKGINGYIADLRLVVGDWSYTDTFNPPSSPVSKTANTIYLLKGTNAGILDATGINNIQTNGSAQLSTSKKKYGSSSVYFNGSNSYLSFLGYPACVFGNADFTIEFWAFPTTSGTCTIFQYGYWSVSLNNLYPRWYSDVANNLTASSAVSLNSWSHVAFCRSGTTMRIFINGTLSGSKYEASNQIRNPSTDECRIGLNLAGGQPFVGYLDDIRITVGVARYTDSFSPPGQLPTR